MRIYHPSDAASTTNQRKPEKQGALYDAAADQTADRAEELSEIVNVIQTSFFLAQRESRRAA